MRWSERDSSAYLSAGHFRRFLEYLLGIVWLLTASTCTLLYDMFRGQCWSRGGAQKPGSEAEHLVQSAGPHTTRGICASCLFLCCARARRACTRTCGRRWRSCRKAYIHISIHSHARSSIFAFSSTGALYQACKLHLILGHLCTAAQSCSATQGHKWIGAHSSPHPFTTVSKRWSR